MKNKKIEKILSKVKNAEEVILYIESLEKDLQEEEKISAELFNVNSELIKERERIIGMLEEKIEIFEKLEIIDPNNKGFLTRKWIYTNILKEYK